MQRLERLNTIGMEGKYVIVLPVASIEYHGVLPLGSDLLIAQCVMDMLAKEGKELERVAIAPPIAYTVSIEHRGAGFTVTVAPDTFSRYIYEVFRSMLSYASTLAIVVPVFHGGVYSIVYASARWAMSEAGKRVITDNFWAFVEKKTLNNNGSISVTHADSLEASILAACGYNEGLGREVKPPEILNSMKNRHSPEYTPWMHTDIDYPALPVDYSRKLGKEIVRSYIGHLISKIKSIYNTTKRNL